MKKKCDNCKNYEPKIKEPKFQVGDIWLDSDGKTKRKIIKHFNYRMKHISLYEDGQRGTHEWNQDVCLDGSFSKLLWREPK